MKSLNLLLLTDWKWPSQETDFKVWVEQKSKGDRQLHHCTVCPLDPPPPKICPDHIELFVSKKSTKVVLSNKLLFKKVGKYSFKYSSPFFLSCHSQLSYVN